MLVNTDYHYGNMLFRDARVVAVFGNQAPDSGNSEVLAHLGTPAQKERWLSLCWTDGSSRGSP